MKILMLNAYFQPEQIAFTHLEKDLLDTFAEERFEIDVITPIPTRGIDEKTRKEYTNKKEEALHDGAVKVHRFWAPREGKNPIIRALRYFWCNLREYQIGKKYKNVDIILCPSTPPTQGLVAAFVKKSIRKHGNKNVRFIYNLQDIFPDSMVNARLTKKNSLLWKIGRKIENFIYLKSDKIITISDDFKLNIINKGVPEKRIAIIPNWVNTENIYPISRKDNILFDKYKLDRKFFYICYSGNIGHSQNLELLVDVAKECQSINKNIRFIIVGEGVAKEKLLNKIRLKHVNNIDLIPFQPYEYISFVFNLGDVGFIISKPGIGKSSIPSKTWCIMAAQKPVLASFDEDSYLGEIIKKIKCGLIVQAGDKKHLVEAINKLYNDHITVIKFAQNGYKHISTTLNKKKCVQSYVMVLKGKYFDNIN